MSKHTHKEDGLPRRDFLRRSVSLVGAGAAGLVVASAHAGEAPAPTLPQAADTGAKGYQENEYTQRYYRMADL